MIGNNANQALLDKKRE